MQSIVVYASMRRQQAMHSRKQLKTSTHLKQTKKVCLEFRQLELYFAQRDDVSALKLRT